MTLRCARRVVASLLLALCAGGSIAPAAQTAVTPAATGVILGKVVDSSGAGVARAIVSIYASLSGTSLYRRAMADEHGDFFFTALPAGEFSFRASKAGYVEGGLGPSRPHWNRGTVMLSEGERRLDVTITIWKHAVVSGRLTDDAGAPIVGVSVGAYRPTIVAGHRRFEGGGGDLTDDRGEFRIFNLDPDDYCLAFVGHSSRRLTLRDATGTGHERRLMFTGASHPAACASGDLVRIDAGQVLGGIDLRSGRVDVASVAVQISVGDEPGDTQIQLRAEPDPATPAVAPYMTILSASRIDRKVTFEGVPPGQYTLTAIKTGTVPPPAPDRSSPQTVIGTASGTSTMTVNLERRGPPPPPPPIPPVWSASMPLVVGSTDITDVSLLLKPAARITGRVEFEGGSRPPAYEEWLRTMTVDILRADGRSPNVYPRVTLSESGFTSSGVSPGRYVIRARSYPGSWHLVEVIIGGRDISTSAIEIGTADITDVTLRFSQRQTSIQGVVQGSTGRADADLQVFLFPSDRRLWIDYGEGSPRFQRMDVERDGSFSTYAPPAGDYAIIATPTDLGRRWQDPAMLAHLLGLADRIVARQGDQTAVSLRPQVIRR